MNLDELTLGQMREIQQMVAGKGIGYKSHPYKHGEQYLIRTVTHYYTGRLVEVHEKELVLEDAAWIADTGRYMDALETGKLNEVEPIKNSKCIIGRGAVIDCVVWTKTLPGDQK